MKFRIYNEDCISGASRFKAESIDLGIFDPPFGINEASFDKHYNRQEDHVISGYEEAPEDYDTFTKEWMTEATRILKPNGSMYIISGWSHLHDILAAARELNLFLINHIIWKFDFGVNTKIKFVTSHYHILYFKKKAAKPTFNNYCRFGPSEKDSKKKSLLYKDMEDVWAINRENRPGEKKNKNKLPDALIRKIILYSSNPGDIVCDFFMGNFTTAYVAARLGRNPVGFELNKKSFEYHMPRLEKITFGNELDTLKDIDTSVPENQGKPIDRREKESIALHYNRLFSQGFKENVIKKKLAQQFGRGPFSITNILQELKKQDKLHTESGSLFVAQVTDEKRVQISNVYLDSIGAKAGDEIRVYRKGNKILISKAGVKVDATFLKTYIVNDDGRVRLNGEITNAVGIDNLAVIKPKEDRLEIVAHA